MTHSSTTSSYQLRCPRCYLSGSVIYMGTPELVMIAIVVLVLFGGSQLPKLAKNLGSAQRELKKAMDDGKSDQKPEGETK